MVMQSVCRYHYDHEFMLLSLGIHPNRILVIDSCAHTRFAAKYT